MKRFFNEKEVTSTLVMDALFSGCKQLEAAGRASEAKKVTIDCISWVLTSSPIHRPLHLAVSSVWISVMSRTALGRLPCRSLDALVG